MRSEPRRILALDWGTKRIGVAISDELGITAQPLTVIPAEDENSLFQELHNICRQHNVETIVVGIPLNMDGSSGTSAVQAKRFAEKIRSRLDIDVVEWDERLSSSAAEQVLLQADISRRRRKIVRDRLAAAIILQSYLDSRS